MTEGKKLAVFGSRTITDDRVEDEISEFMHANPEYNTIVTSQEPKGACTVAQAYAKQMGYVLELHFLDRGKYARGAWWHRSEHIIASADFVLLIHDGISKGTKNELVQTIKNKKPYKYLVLEKTSALENEKSTDILKKSKVETEAIDDMFDFGMDDF